MKCGFLTRKGVPCNRVVGGGGYCYQHKKSGEKVSEKSSRPRLSDFTIKKTLGRGSYGEVQLVKNKKTGEKFALKKINMDKFDIDYLFQELESISFVSWGEKCHPNIVCYKDAFCDNRIVYILMEYIEGETLSDYMHRKGRLDDNEVFRIMESMLTTLSYIHSKGVVHRDIKAANTMIKKNGEIVYVDFGFSCLLDIHKKSVCDGKYTGTPEYMAPELVSEPGDLYYTKLKNIDLRKSDIWSLGILFFNIANGRRPYRGDDLFGKILNKTVRSTHTNTKINSIINYMLVKNFKNRPSADELLEMYFHNRS